MDVNVTFLHLSKFSPAYNVHHVSQTELKEIQSFLSKTIDCTSKRVGLLIDINHTLRWSSIKVQPKHKNLKATYMNKSFVRHCANHAREENPATHTFNYVIINKARNIGLRFYQLKRLRRRITRYATCLLFLLPRSSFLVLSRSYSVERFELFNFDFQCENQSWGFNWALSARF